MFRPRTPYFGSGGCPKRPDFVEFKDEFGILGKSIAEPECKKVIGEVLDLTREILQCPENYRAFLVPGSDTGAVEMMIWGVLGERTVDVYHNEAFSTQWADDCKELGLKMNSYKADYGKLPDLTKYNKINDTIVTWNGTTSGVRVPNGDWIADDREGLVICDATSAVFAVPLPWEKLDVVTFSWQKALGGEAAHGTIILSPRALERLKTSKVNRPVPSAFRITEAMLEDSTNVNNAMSTMCISDALHALRWVKSIGGLSAGIERTESNYQALATCVASNSEWLGFLADNDAYRSRTSVCLTMKLPPKTISSMLALLEKEGVAYDIGAYRTAPAGARVWCGMTVEKEDVAIFTEWLVYVFNVIHKGVKDSAKPKTKPACPNFSSGPCKKYPTFSHYYDPNLVLGRSHRHKLCKGRTVKCANDILSLLQCPRGYVAAIVTGGSIGAMEAALWSFVGQRPVDVFCIDDVSRQYANVIQTELKVEHLNVYDSKGDGKVPDFSLVNSLNDVVLVWNGTTSGVRVPNGDWIADDREGLVICDATSAVFAVPLPWEKLDVVTFSWQKALGGEAAHGTIILSPRALERLKASKPLRPSPKLYRLKKNIAMFSGDVINTISLMCIEDMIQSLSWANRNGGLPFLAQRTAENYRQVNRFVQRNSKAVSFVGEDPNHRSTTSVVFKLNKSENEIKKILEYLKKNGFGSGIDVRGKPTYVRVWCGPTVEFIDLELFFRAFQAVLGVSSKL